MATVVQSESWPEATTTTEVHREAVVDKRSPEDALKYWVFGKALKAVKNSFATEELERIFSCWHSEVLQSLPSKASPDCRAAKKEHEEHNDRASDIISVDICCGRKRQRNSSASPNRSATFTPSPPSSAAPEEVDSKDELFLAIKVMVDRSHGRILDVVPTVQLRLLCYLLRLHELPTPQSDHPAETGDEKKPARRNVKGKQAVMHTLWAAYYSDNAPGPRVRAPPPDVFVEAQPQRPSRGEKKKSGQKAPAEPAPQQRTRRQVLRAKPQNRQGRKAAAGAPIGTLDAPIIEEEPDADLAVVPDAQILRRHAAAGPVSAEPRELPSTCALSEAYPLRNKTADLVRAVGVISVENLSSMLADNYHYGNGDAAQVRRMLEPILNEYKQKDFIIFERGLIYCL